MQIGETGSVLEKSSHHFGSKMAWGSVALGLLQLLMVLVNGGTVWFWIGLFLLSAGSLGVFLRAAAGSGFDATFTGALQTRGWAGWMLAAVLTAFYTVLYWFPDVLRGWIRAMDGFSWWLRGAPADQWLLYGFFYTLAVCLMGLRMLMKHHQSRYQIFRTLSVAGFQLIFAFWIPAFLKAMQEPELYFHYFWPLKYDYLFPSTVQSLLQGSGWMIFAGFWGIILTFIATPVLTYFFGKRWYCSWVCGCGALAETAGDPFRHLGASSRTAWRIERWMIYVVLGWIVCTTGLLWLNVYQHNAVLGEWSSFFAKAYGFWIGSVFSGVIGVGFYPVLGARVWCRFGCPMAAVLGVQQKWFSRFRITTNGGQCISCGQCTTYCEMGIDVRWYAQRGEYVVRASCVGCGICAEVCPRGVLRLENGSARNSRLGEPMVISADEIRILN